MNTKIILFDIDGVIVRPPHYFWRVLEERWYTNAENILNNFFVHENTDCTEWRANIYEKIVPYLEKIWWKKWAGRFFDEQFEFESQYFDRNFISIVKYLQGQWVKCYLATAQENVRAKYFLETVGFEEMFDGHYISCNVWYRKDKPEYWEYTISDLQKIYPELQAEEIVFFDDGKKNVEMARTFWIQALLFENMKQFNNDMKKIWVK